MKKILFVISEMFYSEPLGVMQLSAILKQAGHSTKLAILKDGLFLDQVELFDPDLIAYSTMSPDINLFKDADSRLLTYLKQQGRNLPRIMGGAHPTYFSHVLEEMKLDAICVGDGDRAILQIADRLGAKEADFTNINNVIPKGQTECQKELVDDLDSLPFLDRAIIYDAAPEYRHIAIRSFLTSRGCPYKCTYCFNHSFNKMFQGLGPILRRYSVSRVIAELQDVILYWGPVKIIRFGDDTFVHKKDAWIEEFSERYRREIGLPFYCLMHPIAGSEDIFKLLAHAGCKSISMSIETGDETVRNSILKRNLTDRDLIQSFELANKYGIKVGCANSMLGIPGTTLEDDFKTVEFVKENIRADVPTFSIFAPYPGTDLTHFAIQAGILDQTSEFPMIRQRTALKSYSEKEKTLQLRLAYLGPIYYCLPNCLNFTLRLLVNLPLTIFYNLICSFWVSYGLSSKIFINAYPKNPFYILKHAWLTVKYNMMVDKRSSK